MNQAHSEEENQYIQRFDTATIRDFDFPKESGNQAMPYQQTEQVTDQVLEPVAIPTELAVEQQTPAPLPEPASQPEIHATPSAEPVTNHEPAPLPEPITQPVNQEVQAAEPETIAQQVVPPGNLSQLAQQIAQAAEPRADSRYIIRPLPLPIAAPPIAAPFPVSIPRPGLAPFPVTPVIPVKPGKLHPKKIPKFVNQLVKPPVYCPVSQDENESALYIIDISEFKQQILPPGFPETTVWGYGGTVRDAESCCSTYFRNAPGATFEAIRNMPIRVKWINKLTGPHLFAVDPTLHWANPNDMPMEPPKPWPPFPPGFPDAQSPVPTVTHLHGGEVSSLFDGHPDAWFTADGQTGPAYCTSLYTYPNKQDAATLWYHDHTLGITRLNVYAGLAGFYLLRSGNELNWQRESLLPKGDYEIPLVIQDKSFNKDGSLSFTSVGVNPAIHPYWDPEFFGDSITVNGKVWPNLNVERRQYRFRVLNGSNARFYNLKMSNGMKFMQIGTDGGFLPEPVELETLLLAPGERADLLVDFTGIKPGTKIVMRNDANAPYPDGDPPDADTTGQIMQFTVPASAAAPVMPKKLPDRLNIIPALIPDSPQRILTLNEVQGPNGPITVLLNGQKWMAPVSETPRVGSTEDWVIANLTMDTHPVHLHLIEFLLQSRQDFKADDYNVDWIALNGMPPLDHPTIVLPVEPYLVGSPQPPDSNEAGWKDTVRMNPMQVTRIRVRFAPQDIPVRESRPWINYFPFDPFIGPGYVWHCHILDHEDNEMMRPFVFKQP